MVVLGPSAPAQSVCHVHAAKSRQPSVPRTSAASCGGNQRYHTTQRSLPPGYVLRVFSHAASYAAGSRAVQKCAPID
eukprot:11382645-Karenia_brevis.AAC.1